MAVQKGLNLGVILFIVSEALFFMAIFWAFFHSALTPTVELGAQWPPLGIEPVNPFELPLLNTVNFYTFDIIYIIIAVWVQISFYTFIIHNNFNSYFILSNYPYFINRLNPKSKRYFSLSPRPSACVRPKGTSNNLDVEFYKWFSGFTDAEGSFMITPLAKGFSFRFSIGLHIDDLNVLNYIKDKLGFGKVYSNDNTCHFNVTKKEDILKLINIFDTYLLNSTKRFNFLDFKKAYSLYYNRDLLTHELTNQILGGSAPFRPGLAGLGRRVMKNNMNNLREISENLQKFNISKEWLLGFIEGDGSFSLSRNTMEPVFSIKLSETELSLLYAIKEYLINNLDLDIYSVNKLEGSSVISLIPLRGIGKGKAVNNSKPLATLTIKNVHFLNNVFIPFFDESQFISKKGLDFKDFKLICHTIYKGGYRTERIKNLLINLSMTMNNSRLSNYKGEKVSISQADLHDILASEETIQHLSDGRELDINTKKLIHRRSSSSVFEIFKPSIAGGSEILIKRNLADSAKEIGIGFNTLKRQLDNEFSEAEYKGYKIKRIGVFKKKM